jgi:putative sterol carrier protein
MAKYLSLEWLELGRAAVNANAEFREVAKGMSLTISHVITEVPNKGTVYFWSTFRDGECVKVALGSRSDANFTLTAPYAVWRQVHDGSIEIVQVILEQKMQVEGHPVKGIKILKLAPLMNQLIAEVETEFPGEIKG